MVIKYIMIVIISYIYIADLYEFVRMNPLGAIPQVMNQAYETKNSNFHRQLDAI
jgi:hypothetical protein